MNKVALLAAILFTLVSGRSAALAASIFGAASIVGRVGNGYLVDRFFEGSEAALLELLKDGETSQPAPPAAAAEADLDPTLL